MRHIDKRSPPEVLTDDGANFQNAALRFADGVRGTPYDKDLDKYAVFVGGNFDHYASGLFAKFSFYSNPKVKRQLIAEHAGKCAFCECFVMDTDVGDVEHFRPKSQVTVCDPTTGPEIQVPLEEHPGYFWLSATWGNLYLSCKQCNQAYKRNFFDVWPGTRRMMPGALDEVEYPLLLSPALDDARLRRLIRYDPTNAEAMLNPELFGALPDRNFLPYIKRTIEIVGLNRPRLIEARANHLVKLRSLFVLLANGVCLKPTDYAPPQLTHARPAILNLRTREDTAARDAQLALERAIAPTSEFSALALDALIVWSTELRLQDLQAQVAQQQGNQICLQLEQLRITKAVELAEKVRSANQESSEAEAQPDTADLDYDYNKLLSRYKAEIRTIKDNLKNIRDCQAQANDVRTKLQQDREQNGVAEFMERYSTLLGWDRQGVVPTQNGATLESVRAELGVLSKSMLEDPLATLLTQDSARVASIEQLEGPLDERWGVLNDLLEELGDVCYAYNVRGATRAARGKRCEQFKNALDSLMAWLWDDETALSPEVQEQLDNNRCYPPEIR